MTQTIPWAHLLVSAKFPAFRNDWSDETKLAWLDAFTWLLRLRP